MKSVDNLRRKLPFVSPEAILISYEDAPILDYFRTYPFSELRSHLPLIDNLYLIKENLMSLNLGIQFSILFNFSIVASPAVPLPLGQVLPGSMPKKLVTEVANILHN